MSEEINHPLFKRAMGEFNYKCDEGTVVEPKPVGPQFLTREAQDRWEKRAGKRRRRKETVRLQALVEKHRT